MFDLVFGMMSAWHALGLVLMGVAFMAIGGGILGWELYWRIFSHNLKGVITGIRVNHKKTGEGKNGYHGEMYHAVLSYTTPDGNKVEQVSPSASNYIMSRIPGKRVTVLYFPNAPEKTRRPNLMLLIFGALFFCPGVFVMGQAIKSFEFNTSMFLLMLLIIGFIGYKISGVVLKVRKHIKNMPQEEWDRGWQKFRSEGFKVRSSSSSPASSSVLLTREEIMARLRMRYKYANYMILICCVIGLGLLGGSVYAGQKMQYFLMHAKPVAGEVVRIDSEYNSRSEGSSYTYYSIVKFDTSMGQNIEFRDSVGSSHPMHDIGDSVDVLYLPADPQEAMIDRGVWNWGLCAGLFAASLIFFWAAYFNVKALRFIRRL